jgi:hypothetical protein
MQAPIDAKKAHKVWNALGTPSVRAASIYIPAKKMKKHTMPIKKSLSSSGLICFFINIIS